jgi:NADH:ubiquinone oxidoreductase subunit H
VFIVSALITTVFFGGWTAPFNWPWPYNLNWLDAWSIGILWIPIAGIVLFVGTDIMAAVVRLLGGKAWTAPSAFGLGLLITGALMTAAVGLALFIAFDWVQGIFWFMAKTYVFVFTFVWMRGTLPRVRVDQLMGFAWKWLLPASLLNLFVTATAVIILNR